MAKTIYKAQLSKLKSLTSTVRELCIDFQSPASMSFRAGQFVILHVPHEGKVVRRAYSIASSEHCSEQIRLVFKLVDGGIASEYVRNLETGAELEISGPFGKLFFAEPPTQQVLFLSTGAGISQHLSYITSVAHKYPETEYHLLLGVWNEDELFYQEELDSAKNLLPNFTYEYVLDHSAPDWAGKTGFVTQYIDEFNYLKKETTFYLCGNPAMIKSMKTLLAEQNFPKERIFAEAFN